ncbi:hypothetical protein [Pandoraea anhela]|uniref:Apea-like HEPN domain-containing protein n=1 Tax=Pandoraea anhela TaxID=2508295 RepID=A0A5E4Z0Q7_9BURK|nr:hypothetical protein [Pandoraea anhela]VVE54258.1 hypothetical protein PAN31108_04919 [Pandoraea anhela]
MRIDSKITPEHGLEVRQQFFCECWFNLVHATSIDAFRVRAMNPENVVRELLKMINFEHATETDLGRVAAEAADILSESVVLRGPEFSPSYPHLLALLVNAKPKEVDKMGEGELSKAWGQALSKHKSLVDAFARELESAMRTNFVPASTAWLMREITLADPPGPLTPLASTFTQIASVLDTLLSTLINRGWSIESLFSFYRMVLLPPLRDGDDKPMYRFDDAFGAVCERLAAEPKPYRVTFAIFNVTKPDQFPELVGDIEFKSLPPVVGEKSSNYVKRYAQPGGGRLFATMTVSAEDGRIAGSIASDRIGQVLDVVRYDYERKNIQLAQSFLLEKGDKHMNLALPGTVPNPDSSLSADQLDHFMKRLQDLVNSGTLSSDAKDRIYSAFRLYRIGADTLNFENKLVNWWTAVEFLVKGASNGSAGIGAGVEHSLAPTVTLSYLPKHLAALRGVLVDLKIELRDDADEPIELKSLGLAKFHELLQEQRHRDSIKDHCASRPFIWHCVERFFANSADQKQFGKVLKNHERRVRWHVQRIYRARCDIVHSAQRMVDATLLCANLEFYLKTVLSTFLEALHRHPTLRSPREFFDRQQHAYHSVSTELAQGKATALLTLLANKDEVGATTA